MNPEWQCWDERANKSMNREGGRLRREEATPRSSAHADPHSQPSRAPALALDTEPPPPSAALSLETGERRQHSEFLFLLAL